jgi:hypothetical protein
MKQMAAFMESGAYDSTGPFRILATEIKAAVQIHRTGRSCIAQHFRAANVRVADKDEAATAAMALVSGVER